MSFKTLTFERVYDNFHPECKWLGKKATHARAVKGMRHCDHPTKVGDNFNWACTIESCPYFEAENYE